MRDITKNNMLGAFASIAADAALIGEMDFSTVGNSPGVVTPAERFVANTVGTLIGAGNFVRSLLD